MNTNPTLILFLFLAFCLQSHAEEIDDQALNGKWLHSYKIGEKYKVVGTTVYKEDGTFSGRTVYFKKDEEYERVTYEGRWSIKGNILTTVTRFTSDPSMTKAITQECEIIELTEDTHKYKTPEGKILTENRVKI